MSSQDAVPTGVVLLVNLLLNKEGKKTERKEERGEGVEPERQSTVHAGVILADNRFL